MDDRYRNAIGTVESSNNYGALGPETDSGDRAYGRYQVMGANIPEWTERHLGQRMTPQEFLANKDAQDRVFDSETGAQFKKYGNLDDVTSTWFSGRPVARAGNSSDGYNTVPQYLRKVNAAYGTDGPTAIDQAMGRTGSRMNSYAEERPALYAQQPPGALQNGGSPVTDNSKWDALIAAGQMFKDMAPGIAQDPDNKNALIKAAESGRKVAGQGTWSTHIDPRTGLATQTHSLTGQMRQYQAQPPQPEKNDRAKAYDTADGKAFSEKNQKIADDAVASTAALGNIDTLRAALTNPEVYQGTGGESVAYMKKLGNSVLGMDFKGVADADVAASLINKLTQESRQLNGGMPGSLSDKDLSFLKAANAGLDKSPEANQRILDIYSKLHNRNIEMNQERLAYTQGGKQLDEGFNQRLSAKWAAEHAPENAAFKAEQAAAKANPVAVPANTFKTPQGTQWRRN